MSTAPERNHESISHSGEFAVGAASGGPRATLALKGELDLAGAPLLEREVERLDWPQLAELVFDLADLTFIDSSGLSVLLQAAQRAVTARVRFAVVRVPEQPRKLFTIAGVADILHVES